MWTYHSSMPSSCVCERTATQQKEKCVWHYSHYILKLHRRMCISFHIFTIGKNPLWVTLRFILFDSLAILQIHLFFLLFYLIWWLFYVWHRQEEYSMKPLYLVRYKIEVRFCYSSKYIFNQSHRSSINSFWRGCSAHIKYYFWLEIIYPVHYYSHKFWTFLWSTRFILTKVVIHL